MNPKTMLLVTSFPVFMGRVHYTSSQAESIHPSRAVSSYRRLSRRDASVIRRNLVGAEHLVAVCRERVRQLREQKLVLKAATAQHHAR